jgi:hypothetical protein
MKHPERIACRCGCGTRNVAPGFLEAIAAVEAEVGYELNPRSVCRCIVHNAVEGGKDHSEHLATPKHDCCALDVDAPAAWEDVVKLVQAAQKHGFKGFGYAKDFIHMDMGLKRFWFYPGFLAQHPALTAWKNPVE